MYDISHVVYGAHVPDTYHPHHCGYDADRYERCHQLDTDLQIGEPLHVDPFSLLACFLTGQEVLHLPPATVLCFFDRDGVPCIRERPTRGGVFTESPAGGPRRVECAERRQVR